MIGKTISHLPCEIKMHNFLEIIGPKRELHHDDKTPSTLSHYEVSVKHSRRRFGEILKANEKNASPQQLADEETQK